MTAANRAALAAIRARARRDRRRHLERIERALAGADPEPLLAALGNAPVTINFHPDRLLADGRSVARALLEEGVYRNQFETGISNGALGGERDRWERALFAGAYHAASVTAAERPKYGGLNVLRHLDGACPAFGPCHLRLGAHANQRTTVLFGDSALGGSEIATLDEPAPVLAAMLEARWPVVPVGAPRLGRALHYVEAQVHGPLTLRDDVEAIVIDPCYAGTPDGDRLLAAAERHGVAAEWHPGHALAVADVPADGPADAPFRWQAFCAHGRARRFADEVAGPDGVLDAAVIGRAAARAPARGPERDRLKDLWTIVVAG